MLGLGRKELGHARDDIRLGDRLTLSDLQRVVTVCDVPVGGADELLPRHARDRVEHAPVADAEPLELAHHVGPRA